MVLVHRSSALSLSYLITMVSLIGRLRAPTSVFKRNNLRHGMKNDPIPKRLSHSSDQSTDSSMGSSDEENNVDKPIVVHMIGTNDSDGNKFDYKPVNRSASFRRKSSNGSNESIKVCDSVRELIQKRTSCFFRRSSCTQENRRVTFLDEELGLTPRHIVTETHYRPRTSIEEKKTLYYCSKDFILFERDHLYEKVEAEIKAIERQKKKEQDGDVTSEDEDSEEKEAMDLEQVQRLVQKVRSRLNLEQYARKDAML